MIQSKRLSAAFLAGAAIVALVFGVAPTTAPATAQSQAVCSGCTGTPPGAGWICVNGGWVPPGHPNAAACTGGTVPPPPVSQDAVGSWFGRAVPVPGQTLCPPGAAGCPVPPEIVMIFTVHGDGNFIGIDSNIFAGGDHTTAHGQWVPNGARGIRAEFTLLQSSPQGVFIGGFKNLFEATVVNRDEMQGGIDARLYEFANGSTHVDRNGFPTPSPVAPASECASTPGCTHLGRFSFTVRRVKVN